MKWNFIGEKTVLVAVPSLTRQVVAENPDGSIPTAPIPWKWGYMTPGWKGAPWAPISAYYIPRPVWVVEGYHQDPYYNYGKHTFYVDKELYIMVHKEVCNRAGEYWKHAPNFVSLAESKGGNNLLGWPQIMLIVDDRNHHATASERVYKSGSSVYLPQSKLGPGFFTVSNLQLLSK